MQVKVVLVTSGEMKSKIRLLDSFPAKPSIL